MGAFTSQVISFVMALLLLLLLLLLVGKTASVPTISDES
jgi:hypothetical protein